MNQHTEDFAALFEYLDTAVIHLDAKMRLRYLNPAAEMLLEKSANRVCGKSIKEVCRWQSALLTQLQTVYAESHRLTRREFAIILPSGKELLINLTISPIPGDGVLIEMRHINRLKSISQEAALQKEYNATRNLMRSLAHEIKNPLGGIHGAAQLLEGELPDPELKEYTSVIIKETTRLRKLIDQMLGPKKPLHKIQLNIHEVVEHVVQLIRAEAGKDLHIIRDYDPSIPELMADRDQLIQATLNIAKNSLESMQGKGKICFRTRIMRHYTLNGVRHPLLVQLEICDDGPGIPPELAPHIFFPMISGKSGGSGLGLSIAQSLVGAHQGLVKYRSEPGDTCFQILLPIIT